MPAYLQDAAVFGIPIAFIWVSFVIELTPGPNMTYLAVLSATEGRRAGLSAVAGVALGLAIIGSAAALGLAAVISGSPALYGAMRWGGVLYLLWLAYDTWTGADGHPSNTAFDSGPGWKYFRAGLGTNLLNPKAAIFYIAVLPLFVQSGRPVLEQTLALTAAYVAVATAVHAGIALLAAAARPMLENNVSMTTVRRIMAVAIVAIAVWVVLSTARPAG